jgi:hypothetical protein
MIDFEKDDNVSLSLNDAQIEINYSLLHGNSKNVELVLGI